MKITGIRINGVDAKLALDGKSAYELARDQGFEGTEEEWLASLKGETGEKGEKGDTGPEHQLTEQDKTEIADLVLEAFVNVAEVGQ